MPYFSEIIDDILREDRPKLRLVRPSPEPITEYVPEQIPESDFTTETKSQGGMYLSELVDSVMQEDTEEYNILGGIKDIGKLVYDIPINTIGAFASMWEDDNPEAEYDWKDIARKAKAERNKQRMAEVGGEEKVFPGVQRKDILKTRASAGFSAVAMGAGLAGGLAAAPVPIPGARIAGALAASGAAAYEMDKAAFSQQIIDAARQNNPSISSKEISKILEDTKDIRSKHTLF